MIDRGDLLVWILATGSLSALGRFVDYLLSIDIRRRERLWIQRQFGRLFKALDGANVRGVLTTTLDVLLRLQSRIVGERLWSVRGLLVTLLVSQALTSVAFLAANISLGVPVPWVDGYSFCILIPFAPYIGVQSILLGHDLSGWAQSTGIYWNNYVFDMLTIAITIKCLALARSRLPLLPALLLVVAGASYVLAYLVLFTYFIVPPNSRITPYAWNTFIAELWQAGTFGDLAFLYYSVTTLVPVSLVLLFFLFCIVVWILQWILAAIAYDFARDSERSAFFKLSSALAIIALLLKTAYEAARN